MFPHIYLPIIASGLFLMFLFYIVFTNTSSNIQLIGTQFIPVNSDLNDFEQLEFQSKLCFIENILKSLELNAEKKTNNFKTKLLKCFMILFKESISEIILEKGMLTQAYNDITEEINNWSIKQLESLKSSNRENAAILDDVMTLIDYITFISEGLKIIIYNIHFHFLSLRILNNETKTNYEINFNKSRKSKQKISFNIISLTQSLCTNRKLLFENERLIDMCLSYAKSSESMKGNKRKQGALCYNSLDNHLKMLNNAKDLLQNTINILDKSIDLFYRTKYLIELINVIRLELRYYEDKNYEINIPINSNLQFFVGIPLCNYYNFIKQSIGKIHAMTKLKKTIQSKLKIEF
ncbi:hypothetical protein TCON_2399 [Astathelohania contejeani]|uniref:Uncharacterized protein n=1 Tax=Astathelohania contejeani TaxID=164912 RepID=A0ABQ7HW41_9MICR|nr:hypothetical protein TCON_2399 [Thelohania contejeani]